MAGSLWINALLCWQSRFALWLCRSLNPTFSSPYPWDTLPPIADEVLGFCTLILACDGNYLGALSVNLTARPCAVPGGGTKIPHNSGLRAAVGLPFDTQLLLLYPYLCAENGGNLTACSLWTSGPPAQTPTCRCFLATQSTVPSCHGPLVMVGTLVTGLAAIWLCRNTCAPPAPYPEPLVSRRQLIQPPCAFARHLS